MMTGTASTTKYQVDMASDVKILLVDDNPMVLGMLQQALSTMGEVTVANDSADALLKAVEDVPDVMISDYRMPGMDGRQLLEKLKGRRRRGLR
jgi:CheY-like chemotaxis protein